MVESMPAYHLAKFQTPRHRGQVLIQRVDKQSAFAFNAATATFRIRSARMSLPVGAEHIDSQAC